MRHLTFHALVGKDIIKVIAVWINTFPNIVFSTVRARRGAVLGHPSLAALPLLSPRAMCMRWVGAVTTPDSCCLSMVVVANILRVKAAVPGLLSSHLFVINLRA